MQPSKVQVKMQIPQLPQAKLDQLCAAITFGIRLKIWKEAAPTGGCIEMGFSFSG